MYPLAIIVKIESKNMLDTDKKLKKMYFCPDYKIAEKHYLCPSFENLITENLKEIAKLTIRIVVDIDLLSCFSQVRYFLSFSIEMNVNRKVIKLNAK